METIGVVGHGFYHHPQPMTRPHVFRFDQLPHHIMGDAGCVWFGPKWNGTIKNKVLLKKKI